MYILFEEHQYDSQLVENILKDIYVLQDINKKVSVQYVGYFYNPHLHDCVFILPKVLLEDKDGEEVLSGVTVIRETDGISKTLPVTPEQMLTPKDQKILSKEYRKFVYEFSIWIYRALCRYYKTHSDSKAILYKRLPQAGRGKRAKANTYLDIVLSLINFNKENRDFVLFTVKNLHRGNNKINWVRTINRSSAIVQGQDAIYLNPVNKKRVVNYEEELFIIFYSILNYLNEEYGFRTPIVIQYDLLTGKAFAHYLKGLGKIRLMQIKYKYFSDKTLQLWDLCYAFFESAYKIAVHTHAQEYILAKSFHVVFEAMIDELIGTPHSQIPKGLADQLDGKRVDHMYTDLALTSVNSQTNREVYYIGDSKYYKHGNKLGAESIYKQYTYARNVVQWNVNLFLAGKTAYDDDEKDIQEDDYKRFGHIRLQDNTFTEGYDIIPNFFIRGFVDSDRKYNAKENIRKFTDNNGEHCTTVSYQFPDRLFDRDTLFLSQYDVNFLYVLYLYGRNKANEKAKWKSEVRKLFREEIRDVIQKRYNIYAMRAKQGVDGQLYLQQHFYELNGRVFQPYGAERQVYFAFAMSSDRNPNTDPQYKELEKVFHIEKCEMGKDPQEVLKAKVEAEIQQPVATPQWLTLHYLERYVDKGILIGYYKDEAHLQWIMGNNDKGSLIYNVRLAVKGEEPRAGAHTASFYDNQNVQFVILYTDGVEETNEYRVFHVKDTAKKVTEERMKDTWYPSTAQGSYYFYRFDEEVTLGKLRIADMIGYLKAKAEGYADGEPLFITAEELLNLGYRVGF